jgi:hypothetical protein
LLVAASRFVPHPPNVACVGALGLFAGCYLVGRRAYLVPLAVLLLSDLVGQLAGIPGMGFYNPITMVMVYAATLAAIPVGRWLRDTPSKLRLPAGALAASVLFFLISNFGVWLGGWYPMTGLGLVTCFTNAIPFFGYTLAGNLVFTLAIFGAYEYRRVALVPALNRVAAR